MTCRLGEGLQVEQSTQGFWYMEGHGIAPAPVCLRGCHASGAERPHDAVLKPGPRRTPLKTVGDGGLLAPFLPYSRCWVGAVLVVPAKYVLMQLLCGAFLCHAPQPLPRPFQTLKTLPPLQCDCCGFGGAGTGSRRGVLE